MDGDAPVHAEGNELTYCVNLINGPDNILTDIDYTISFSPITASELQLCI